MPCGDLVAKAVQMAAPPRLDERQGLCPAAAHCRRRRIVHGRAVAWVFIDAACAA